MDITDLRSTRQLLKEASYKFLVTLSDGTVMYYGRQKANIPGVIFKPADGNTLMDSNHIFSVIVNNAAGTKMWNAAVEANNSGTVTTGSREYEFINLWASLAKADENSVDLRAMSEFPSVFKIAELHGRDRMFKYLTTDLRMRPAMFVIKFGEIPELGEEHFVKFHDARVFIPDNARAASKKSMMDVLETLYQHLRANGFGFLFHGDIRFIQITGKVIGLYNINTKAMTIQPKVKKSKDVIFTLLHEFSHKYWYEYMDQGDRNMVSRKFNDLRRGGEAHMKDSSLLDASIEEIKSSVTPGMKLNYKGRKSNFKKYSPYIIRGITDDGYMEVSSEEDSSNFIRMRVPFGALTTARWEVPALEIKKHEPVSKYDMESDQWFPTPYSMGDPEEWFAELMGFYFLDHLNGEPEAFIEEVFGV